MSKNAAFVADYLKTHDRDRYYATLVLPEPYRADVQALYAFNADVALIAQRVSEPAPGEIRLQWWMDFLAGSEHGAAQQNPLAAALSEAINKVDLPTGPLRRLLAARRFDLYGDPMPDLNAFEGYAGETNSILYQLSTLILNNGNDAEAADAAGHLGVAHSLVGHLRVLGKTAGEGKVFLPWSVFSTHGVTEADLFGHEASAQMIKATTEMRELASEHIDLAEEHISRLPAGIKPAFAAVVLLRTQLERLAEFEDIPFVSPPDSANWQKIAKLVWWAMRN